MSVCLCMFVHVCAGAVYVHLADSLTWECNGSVAAAAEEVQEAVAGLGPAADRAPPYACVSSICSPYMLLYMVRKPRGCLTEAGRDLMLPLDAPLQHQSGQLFVPAAKHIFY